jgi:TonB family protein
MNKTSMVIILLGLLLSPFDGFSQSESKKVIMVLEGDLGPYWKVKSANPAYFPAGAQQHKIQGCASVGFFIEPDGTTSDHQLLVSSPKGVFDKSAIKAAKKLTFERSEQNNAELTVFTSRTYTYTYKVVNDLEDGKGGEQRLAKLCIEAANENLKSIGGAG